MPFQAEDLYPVLALIVWTLVMLLWMYATRIPAMQKAKIDPNDARHPGAGYNDKIPSSVRSVADNYNHLHEQPTIFYALVFFAALTGGSDNIFMYLAWAYVGLRVIHTIIHLTNNNVSWRAVVFGLSSACLVVMIAREGLALL